MIQIVNNTIQSRIQKSWASAKQTDDLYTSKTNYKKNIHKRKGRAPNLCTYRDKNKARDHTINSCEMLQTSDKSTKKAPTLSSILTIKLAGLAWARQTFLKIQLGSDIDIRFDFLLRRHYMLCLSQCKSDSALTRTYWPSGGTAGGISSYPKLFLFEPFLLFWPPFWILERVAAIHLFPDSRFRFPVPRSPFPVLVPS